MLARRVVTRDGKATGVQYIDAGGARHSSLRPRGAGDVTLNTPDCCSFRIGHSYDGRGRKGTPGKNLTIRWKETARFFDKPLNAFHGYRWAAMRISISTASRRPDGRLPKRPPRRR